MLSHRDRDIVDIFQFAEWLIELNKPDECKMLLRLRYV